MGAAMSVDLSGVQVSELVDELARRGCRLSVWTLDNTAAAIDDNDELLEGVSPGHRAVVAEALLRRAWSDRMTAALRDAGEDAIFDTWMDDAVSIIAEARSLAGQSGDMSWPTTVEGL
jgi:hypothetical protein